MSLTEVIDVAIVVLLPVMAPIISHCDSPCTLPIYSETTELRRDR